MAAAGKAEPGWSRRFHRHLPWVGRGASTQAVSCCFSSLRSRELDQRWESWDSNLCPCKILVSQELALPVPPQHQHAKTGQNMLLSFQDVHLIYSKIQGIKTYGAGDTERYIAFEISTAYLFNKYSQKSEVSFGIFLCVYLYNVKKYLIFFLLFW